MRGEADRYAENERKYRSSWRIKDVSILWDKDTDEGLLCHMTGRFKAASQIYINEFLIVFV